MVTGLVVQAFSGTGAAPGGAGGAFSVSGASPYGNPIPRLYGRVKLAGAPIWTSKLRGVQTTVGSLNGTATSNRQEADFAVMFGEAPPNATTTAVLRLWVNGTLVYDVTGDSDAVQKSGYDFTIYPGSTTQGTDPTIAAQEGANTPAFRGRIYVVFRNYPLTYATAFPKVEADIMVNTQKVVRIRQYNTDNASTPNYQSALVDWQRKYLLAVDAGNSSGTNFDVYSTKWKRAYAFNFASPLHAEYAFTLSYKNARPWAFVQKLDLSNSNTIYCFDYEGGEVIGTFGTDDAGTTSDSAGFTHPTCFRALKPYDKNAELILVGTSFHETGFVKVASDGTLSYGDVLYSHTTFAAAPLDVPQGVVKLDPGRALRKIDTSKFSVAYAGGRQTDTHGRVYQIIAAAGVVDFFALPIAYDREPDLAVYYFGLHDYVFTPNDYVISASPGMVEVHDFGAGTSVYHVHAGPAENPYVSVVYERADGTVWLARFDTPWTVAAPDKPSLTIANVAATAAAIAATFTLVREIQLPSGIDWGDFARNSHSCMRPGVPVFGVASGGHKWCVIDTFSVAYTETDLGTGYSFVDDADGVTSLTNVDFQRADIYDPVAGCVYYTTPRTSGTALYPGAIRLKNNQPNPLNLGDYLRELAATAGYDYDTQTAAIGLADVFVTGGIINVATKLLDVLQQICDLFRVDIIQRPGVITFVNRARGASLALDATVTVPDDVATLEADAASYLKIERTRDIAVQTPGSIVVDYIDGDHGNIIGTQTAKRSTFPVQTTRNTTEQKLSVPVIMTAGDALYWATRALFDIWGGATTFRFRLPPKFLYLEPSDMLTLAMPDGTQYLVKLTTRTINDDLSLSVEGRTFQRYANEANTPPSAIVDTEVLFDPEPEQPFFFSNMLLFDADNSDGATIPYNWGTEQQAGIYTLDPTGYRLLTTTPSALVGRTRTKLPDAGNTVWQIDTSTQLKVSFDSADGGTFQNLSDLEFFAGVNAALVGDNGRWEVIYWKNSTRNADKSWTFDTIIRGRRGTEVFQASHLTAEWFIPLNKLTVQLASDPIANLGTSTTYKTVTFGMSADDPTNDLRILTSTGGPLKPLAPSNVHVAWDGTNYALTWTRRDRLSNELHDGDATVANSEATETYDVDIYAPGPILVHSATDLAAPSYTYTGAQATTDGFSNPVTGLRVVVYQKSAAVGRGYPGGGLTNVE